MAEQRKYRLDNKLTAMMVEDMLFDPILAGKVIFDMDLPPHEELRVMWMWNTYYTNDDSGFSTGKSWTFAYVSALRSILMAGRVSGIISKTFSQGKLIFSNYDRWYDTSKIFRSCVKHAAGKKRLVHGTDAWIAYFRGGSEIRVLPPNFLGDVERLRSERWNDAYLDEWTTYGNFKALNTTILGRVTRINRFPECPVMQNHIHQASTPGFMHDPSYAIVKMVDRNMRRGNHNYGRYTCNYRHIPDTEQWRFLVSRKVIFHMQTVNPKGIVTSEIDGRWSKDSASFYNSRIVNKVRMDCVPLLTSRGPGRGEVFIAGFDVAIGGGDNSSSSGDDFSMSVMRMTIGEWIPHHVMTVRYNRVSDIFMSGIVHKFNQAFGFSLIVFDPSGGGLFVKDKLRNKKQLIDGEMKECTPIITMADTSGTIGTEILVPFSRGDVYIKQMWGKLASDSMLINNAHREFKGAIEQKRVLLSGKWSGWTGNEASWDADSKRDWLNKHQHTMEASERYRAEMDLAVTQLVLVDTLRDKNGFTVLDSFNQYKFKSKDKKDSAYGLVYCYTGIVIYKWMMESGITDETGDDNEGVAFSIRDLA